MTPISFAVIGQPRPQGSKRAFAVGGKARMKESGGLEFAAWRNAISEASKREAERLGEPLCGPLAADLTFRCTMPASRPAGPRRAGIGWRTSSPDIDKLCRCVLDALTASGLIRDDALIVDLRARKIETTGWTGATITLSPAEDVALTAA